MTDDSTFTWETGLPAKKEPKNTTLESAASILTLLIVATWLIFIVPVAVIVWKAAF